MQWQTLFSHKAVQITVSALFALLLSFLLTQISLKWFAVSLIFAAVVVYVYQKIADRIDPIPVLLVKLLTFSAFIGSGVILAKVGPISIFPYRLLVPIVFLIFFAQVIGKDQGLLHWRKVQVKAVLIFFAIWLCYGLFSLIWVKALKIGIKEFGFLVLGIAFIYLFVFYFTRLKDYLHLFYIWLAALACLTALGLFENITAHHLAVSRIPGLPDRYSHIPTAVFHNENDYAMFLTMSVFFLIPFIRYVKDFHFKLYGIFFAVLTLYLLYATHSRASFLALGIGLLLYVLVTARSKGTRVILLVGGTVVALAAIVFHDKLFNLLAKIQERFEAIALAVNPENSLSIRVNLIRNSLHFLGETFGAGVGSGNAEYYMAHNREFPTDTIINVHNWWIEILVDYGILIFTGYLLVYVFLLFAVYRALRQAQNDSHKMICEALLGGLLAFSLASISPSSIMTLKFQWVFIAFAIGYLNFFRLSRRSHKDWRQGDVNET